MYCAENGSNTPDDILAGFLLSCLESFDHAVYQRDRWYGVDLAPGRPYEEVIMVNGKATPISEAT